MTVPITGDNGASPEVFILAHPLQKTTPTELSKTTFGGNVKAIGGKQLGAMYLAGTASPLAPVFIIAPTGRLQDDPWYNLDGDLIVTPA